MKKLPLDKLPLDILQIIASYVVPKQYELNPKIDPNNLSPYFLNGNPCEKNVETVISKSIDDISKLDFFLLSKNPLDSVVEFLLQKEKNGYYISWLNFSTNSNDKAVEFMLSRTELVEWYGFSENTSQKAVDYLLENKEKIRWAKFSTNNNQKAVDYLLTHQEHINYVAFCQNTNQDAVNHLIENEDKISMQTFVKNTNDTAVDYILKKISGLTETEKEIFFTENFNIFLNSNDRIVNCLIENPKYILWCYFIINISFKAIDYILLPENKYNVNWNIFSTNPSIFRKVYDHEAIREFALCMY